jgi:hypothetical protein
LTGPERQPLLPIYLDDVALFYVRLDALVDHVEPLGGLASAPAAGVEDPDDTRRLEIGVGLPGQQRQDEDDESRQRGNPRVGEVGCSEMAIHRIR